MLTGSPQWLQGFGRVRVNAALTSVAALLEMGGSAAVLLWPARQPAPPTAAPASTSASGLLAVGCVTCACQALLAAAALACIVALPPAEARGRVDLLREVLGLSSRWSRKSGSPGSGSGSASQPLLAGRTEEAAAAATAPGGSPIRGGMEAEEVQGTPQQPQKQQGAEQQQQPCSEGGSARLLDAATLEFLRRAPLPADLSCGWSKGARLPACLVTGRCCCFRGPPSTHGVPAHALPCCTALLMLRPLHSRRLPFALMHAGMGATCS